VDVSQDVIIREEDCGTEKGLVMPIGVAAPDGTLLLHDKVETSVFSRTLATDVEVEGTLLGRAGEDVGDVMIDQLLKAGVTELKDRAGLTCESRGGTCPKCYGRSIASGKLVDIAEAVGIITAHSLGEQGTQLTMRTFHTGGVASADDITQGLPRVTELFEARNPKGESPISAYSGRITIDEAERTRRLVIKADEGSEWIAYPVAPRERLFY